MVHNRPGLSAVARRVGTHARFKRSMLARLSRARPPAIQTTLRDASLQDNDNPLVQRAAWAELQEALRRLSTRDDDDFAIALLDAWATTADVLTFYQERITNEAYLRTATERRSLAYLAHLIGYQPRPGLAASGFLAFTLDEPRLLPGQRAPGVPTRTVIDIGTKVQSVPEQGQQPQTFETVDQIEARVEWNAIRPRSAQQQAISTSMPLVIFNGAATNLRPGDMLLVAASSAALALRRVIAVDVDAQGQFTTVALQTVASLSMPSGATLPTPAIYALRTRASLFGYNAPEWALLPLDARNAYNPSAPDSDDWPLVKPSLLLLQIKMKGGVAAGKTQKTSGQFVGSTSGTVFGGSASAAMTTDRLRLDVLYGGIAQDSWAVVYQPGSGATLAPVNGVEETGASEYSVSGKVTRLTLGKNIILSSFFALRQTTVYAQSERLDLVPGLRSVPLVPPTLSGATIQLAGVYADLQPGQPIAIAGVRLGDMDAIMSEIGVIAATSTTSFGTLVTLTANLEHVYVLSSVTINANVARATHGETRAEVLGSGDASQPFQRFTLRQPPLTYIGGGSDATGAQSTLEVRVNDLLWQETSTLTSAGPKDRVYTTSTDGDGKTTVLFGDGQNGARLPSGQENVRAIYRRGLGAAGVLKANQFSLLLTRPLGVREVTNPVVTENGADPEALEDVRRNAALTIMTLDRIVSLQDYEDFARAFTGVAKALATWTWSGQQRHVFVTVASANGVAISPTSELFTNLLATMRAAGDPLIPLQLGSYRSATFQLAADVKVASDALPDVVLKAVENALRRHFAFDARQFGQPVTESEIIAVIQNVPSVVAVNVRKLFRTDAAAATPQPPSLLVAAAPKLNADGTLDGVELLTLDPGPLTELGTMP